MTRTLGRHQPWYSRLDAALGYILFYKQIISLLCKVSLFVSAGHIFLKLLSAPFTLDCNTLQQFVTVHKYMQQLRSKGEKEVKRVPYIVLPECFCQHLIY